jgi:hypothetical protein
MATYDLTEFLEDDSIVLEGIAGTKYPDGKAYRFASPDAKTGLWLKNLIEFGVRANLGLPVEDGTVGKLQLDDDEERDMYVRVMGPTYDELVADGVSWSRLQRVFGLLLRHYGSGQDIAGAIAGEAEARPNRATRRAAKKTVGSSSSRASGATQAPTRKSGSSRSSKTTAAPAKAPRAKAG